MSQSNRDGFRLVEQVRGRPFKLGIPTDTLNSIQDGTIKTRYKDRRFVKNPFDVVLYLKLIEALRPGTIIEVGTMEGGSAVWFKDQTVALGLDCKVVSIDLKAPPVPIPNGEFRQGDATRAQDSFGDFPVADYPKPWLVIEDSAHTYEAT